MTGTARSRSPGPGGVFAAHHVAAAQAAYYILTGLWPLLHRSSFERITGAKTDFWLVQTVGVTVAAIGAGLAQAAAGQRAVPPELRTVAGTSAAGLALVDIFFVGRRRISPVYLLDAAVEVGFIAGWANAQPTAPADASASRPES